MKKSIFSKSPVFAALIIFTAALLLIGAAVKTDKNAKNDNTAITLSADEVTDIVIVSSEGSNFSVYFSSDAMQADQALAADLEKISREIYGIRLRYKIDTSARPAANEVLIGNTNRPESASLKEHVDAVTVGDELVWAFAVMNGKLLYTANSATAFSYGAEKFKEYLTQNNFTVPSDLFVLDSITKEEYDTWIQDKLDKEKQEIINALIEKNSAFTQEQFGGAPMSMGTSPYDPPALYPAQGVHPRLFITPDKLDDVRAAMEDVRYRELVNRFWESANKGNCIDGFPRVNYSDPNNQYSNKYGEDWYAYDYWIINSLQNKAFAYLLTGDEQYGYEAIIGAKNMILTLTYSTWLHMDMYHGPSHIMIAVAKIYDWCYDLMTEEDKMQIIAGVSNILCPGMEMKFPPTGMSAVSGHGTGPQFLRDYFMVSVAFFDEMPDWWELVGGRYFEEYVPVVNLHTQNGWVTQGSGYGPGKFYDGIISFRLIYLASGQYSYNEDGIRSAPYYSMSQLQPNGRVFQSGDDGRSSQGSGLNIVYYIDVAATFGDPVLTAYIYEKTTNLTSIYDYAGWGVDFCEGKTLAYLAYMPEPAEDPFAHIDAIQYFDHPAGTMSARSNWVDETGELDPNAAAVFMKIGTMTMANHDILDHGTFQIYYKGLLAGVSGAYKKYGSNVHRYYLQATVSGNGILVFNPAFAADTPTLGSDGELDVTNGSVYYYSGGQKRRSEAGTLENWLGGDYNMGEITGYDMAYSYEDGSSEYGYIAGDITNAYDPETVKYLERRMLSVFTDDPNYPMLFFTFDTVESVKDSFSKTFLLHTVKEPEIDEATMSADIREGEGRLFVQSLFGANKIEKVGGPGKAYWINGYYNANGQWIEGKNCVDQYAPDDNAENIWGRIQFLGGGDKAETQMLTAMFVTDSTNEESVLFEKLESETVYGAKWRDIYTVFLKSRDRQYKEFTFDTVGTGLSKYYISGIEAGTWKVLVDGVAVATVAVDETSAFASFYAPSGTVTFKPTDNVVGTNGGKIQYITGGGLMGDDAPYSYRNETATPLPTDVTRGEDTFVGWYTSPGYEDGTRITEIPAGTTGTVRVYAKWLSVFVNEDYSSTAINHGSTNKSYNGINYNGSSKPGVSYITKTDEFGVNYLEWVKGEKDPLITVTSDIGKSLADVTAEDETVSFELSLSKNGDAPTTAFTYRIMSDVEYGTNKSRVWGELVIFSGTSSGTIKLGTTGPVIGNLEDGKILNIRVAVDFANCKLIAYNELGGEIQSMDFTVPSGSKAPNGVEWRKLMKQYISYWYPGGNNTSDTSLRIYKHKISEGNTLYDPEMEKVAIKYNTNGGVLSDGAPFYYTPGEATPLPEITKTGAVFGGWYSSDSYDDADRVTEVPKDHEGPFYAYAKWDMTFVDTDFEGSSINASADANGYFEGLEFGTSSKTGSSAVTKTDENGKTYIEFVRGSKDPIYRATNESENLSTMTGSKVSYSFKFRKKAGAPVMSTGNVTLESNVDVNGAGNWGILNLFQIKEDGRVLAGLDSSVVVATITEDKVSEVNFVIDFKYGKVTFYNEVGEDMATFFFKAPEKSGASSTLEWQKLIKRYFFYMRVASGAEDSALLIYGTTVKEGNIFKDTVSTGNDIIYKLEDGYLPAGSPTSYDPAADTLLPTPVKENATFGGWYTSPAFEEGSRTDRVPAGTTGAFAVYAKWAYTFVDVDFAGSNINGEASYGGLNLFGNTEKGACYTTKIDESGRTYVEWVKGDTDSIVSVKNTSENFSTMEGTAASYSFKFRKQKDAPLIHNLQIILESDKKADGTSGWNGITLFRIKENGDIVSGVDGTTVITTITEDSIAELNFVIDFAKSKMIFYDEGGGVIVAQDFTHPAGSGAATALEWQRLIKQYMLYCRAADSSNDPASVLMLYGVKIAEGNIFGVYN